MKTQAYDLIGDIHGHHALLISLLAELGYLPQGRGFRHPEGRQVIFLGDYIDRGPQVREVLHTVRAMVDSGMALAIMGNHEYNAVCYHTPDGRGGSLRTWSPAKDRQMAATRCAFADHASEWAGWLEWMKRLPMFLDLGALRCVHACWDAASISLLQGNRLTDEKFLRASAMRGTSEYSACEQVLKGPEIPTTEGNLYRDKDGTWRHSIRTRWWDLEPGLTINDVVMPPGSMDDRMPVDAALLRSLPSYAAEEPPVFFGHYWLPATAPKTPLRSNLACLDFSAGLGGPLVAYRWDGETQLSEEKFVMVGECKSSHSVLIPASQLS